MSGDYKI